MGIHIQTYTDNCIISSAEDEEIRYYTQIIKSPYRVGTVLEEELVHAPYKLLAIALDDRSKLEALRSAFEASAYAAEITCEFRVRGILNFITDRQEREMRCGICAVHFMCTSKHGCGRR